MGLPFGQVFDFAEFEARDSARDSQRPEEAWCGILRRGKQATRLRVGHVVMKRRVARLSLSGLIYEIESHSANA